MGNKKIEKLEGMCGYPVEIAIGAISDKINEIIERLNQEAKGE